MSDGIREQFEFLKHTFDTLDSTTGLSPKKEPEQAERASQKSGEEGAVKTAGVFGKIVIKKTEKGEIEFETKDTAKKTSRSRLFKRLTSKESYDFNKAVMNLDVKLRALIDERGKLNAEELKQLKNWTESFNTFVEAAAKRKFRPKWFTFGMQKKQDAFIARHQIGTDLQRQVQLACQHAEKEKPLRDADIHFFDLKRSWKDLSKDYRKKPSGLVKNLTDKVDESVHQVDALIRQAKDLPPNARAKKMLELNQAMQKLEKQIKIFGSAVPKFDEAFTRYKDREKFKSEVVKQVWDDITQEMVANLSKRIDNPKADSIEELFIPLQEKIESLTPLLSYLDDFIEKTKDDQSLADLRKRAKEVANAINEFVPNLLEPAHRALPLSLQSLVLQLREIDSFVEQTYTDKLAEEFGQDGSQVVAELRREGYSALVECLEKAGKEFEETAGIRSLKFNPMIKQAEKSLASLKAEYEKMKPILPLFPYAEGVIERIQGDRSLQKKAESAVDNMKEFFPNLFQAQILVLDDVKPFLKGLRAIEQFIEDNYTEALEKEFGKDGPAIVAELRKQAYAELVDCLNEAGEAFQKADEASTFEFKPLVERAQARLGKLEDNLAKERQANKEFLQNVAALNARGQKAIELAKKFHDSVQSGLQEKEQEAQAPPPQAQVTQKQKEPAKPTPALRSTVSKADARPPVAKLPASAQTSVSSLINFYTDTKAKFKKVTEVVVNVAKEKGKELGKELGDLADRGVIATDQFLTDLAKATSKGEDEDVDVDETPAPTPQLKPIARPVKTEVEEPSALIGDADLETLKSGLKEAREDFSKLGEMLTQVRDKTLELAAHAKKEAQAFGKDVKKIASPILLTQKLDKLAAIAQSRGPDTIFSINPAEREKRRKELEEHVTRLERDVAKLQDDILELYKKQ